MRHAPRKERVSRGGSVVHVRIESIAGDQALKLFWAKGYASASLKDLERVTGMHPGSIYGAFGSKAGLYAQAMERYVEWIEDAGQAVKASAPTVLDGMADFVDQAHPISNEDAPVPACFLVKTTMEIGMQDIEIKEKLTELLEANDQRFERTFQAAIDAGELPSGSNANVLAAQLSADLAGLSFRALLSKDRQTVKELTARLSQLIRSGRFANL